MRGEGAGDLMTTRREFELVVSGEGVVQKRRRRKEG